MWQVTYQAVIFSAYRAIRSNKIWLHGAGEEDVASTRWQLQETLAGKGAKRAEDMEDFRGKPELPYCKKHTGPQCTVIVPGASVQ